jgi:hypothetical protein
VLVPERNTTSGPASSTSSSLSRDAEIRSWSAVPELTVSVLCVVADAEQSAAGLTRPAILIRAWLGLVYLDLNHFIYLAKAAAGDNTTPAGYDRRWPAVGPPGMPAARCSRCRRRIMSR